MRLIIGISGASGAIYGIRLLEEIRGQSGIETHLIISDSAKINIQIETDYNVRQVEALADVVHAFHNTSASIASGSFITGGMIVAPASMKSLSSIVHCHSDNLLSRAADVVLKEGRKLVLMPRESPLHAGHCKLLYGAAKMGIHIVPPMPAFYNRPETIADIVGHSVSRVLDLFDIDTGIVKRWDGMDNVKHNCNNKF